MATDQKYRVAGRTATFRPPLWATLAVIPVIGLCVAAGFWQLGRAEAKRQLFATFDAASQERLADGPVPDEHAAAYRYQYLTVTGRYDADRQVLLDNMVYKGRVGYQVLTPLRTGNKAVLVNRGWIAADSDRSRVPTLAVDDQQRPVRGRLNLLPRPGLRLESPPPAAAAAWPRRMLFPKAAEIAAQVGYPVHDYQLLLDPQEPDGFVRDWRPEVMGTQTHIGYATQWFAFAIALAIIYVLVNRRSRSPQQDDA